MSEETNHDILSVDPDEIAGPEDVPADALRAGLRSDADRTRTHAARVAAVLAGHDARAAAEYLPEFVDLLDDQWNLVVFQTTLALVQVAEAEPERLEPAVPGLARGLSSDLPLIQLRAARALGLVALERPEYLTGVVDDLVEATRAAPVDVADPEYLEGRDLDEPSRRSHRQINKEARVEQSHRRAIVANLLVEVAAHDPSLLVEHVSEIADALSAEDADVVAPVADALGSVAEEDPAAVADAVDPLVDQLDHPDDGTAATVVSALGYAGDPAAADPLRELASDDDRPADLRDLAEETAAFLESTAG